MKNFFQKIETFLRADATKTSVSVTEYFVCGWLILTGIQAIVGWFFNGAYTQALDYPESLWIAGSLFIVCGGTFTVIKVKHLLKYHPAMLLFINSLFTFGFILQVIIIPEAVGLWVGQLLLAIMTAAFYLRYKLLSWRNKNV